MIFIVFLTLFIKSLSFSIISNYSGFHNFTDKENITLTIKVNRTSVDIGKNISYNISIYDFEQNISIQFKDLIENAPLSPGIYKMYDGNIGHNIFKKQLLTLNGNNSFHDKYGNI